MSDKYAALKQAAESNINILENIAGYDPEDIDGDTVELRFEHEKGYEAGCDVSIVDQCQTAADVIRLLLAERDAGQEATVKAQRMADYWKSQCREIADHCEKLQGQVAERDADKSRITELEAQASTHDRLCDSNYIAGMKTGWNLGIADDNAGFNQCLAARVRCWPDSDMNLKIEGE